MTSQVLPLKKMGVGVGGKMDLAILNGGGGGGRGGAHKI